MILGTGVDIVELARMRSAWERWGERFAERLLTASESAEFGRRKDKAAFLASRFAAKEAFLKALGTGYADGISWQEMAVCRPDGKRPQLTITGQARRLMEGMGATAAHLSISHERNYAVAQVILEGGE